MDQIFWKRKPQGRIRQPFALHRATARRGLSGGLVAGIMILAQTYFVSYLDCSGIDLKCLRPGTITLPLGRRYNPSEAPGPV